MKLADMNTLGVDVEILRPVTADGMVGYDAHGNFRCRVREERHDSPFDATPVVVDVRKLRCPICDHGWEPNGTSMADQVEFTITSTVAHESCVDRYANLSERERFLGILRRAKVSHRTIENIPNGYWGERSKRAWFSTELVKHAARIEFGYRKRVMSIRVIAEGGCKLEKWGDVEAAFTDEEVTKSFSDQSVLVHSWNRENDRLYLCLILDMLGFSDRKRTQEAGGT